MLHAYAATRERTVNTFALGGNVNENEIYKKETTNSQNLARDDDTKGGALAEGM